jgi:hypothetical protein
VRFQRSPVTLVNRLHELAHNGFVGFGIHHLFPLSSI